MSAVRDSFESGRRSQSREGQATAGQSRHFALSLLGFARLELWYADVFLATGDLERAKRSGSKAALALKGALSHA